jgi:hypothetical protein
MRPGCTRHEPGSRSDRGPWKRTRGELRAISLEALALIPHAAGTTLHHHGHRHDHSHPHEPTRPTPHSFERPQKTRARSPPPAPPFITSPPHRQQGSRLRCSALHGQPARRQHQASLPVRPGLSRKGVVREERANGELEQDRHPLRVHHRRPDEDSPRALARTVRVSRRSSDVGSATMG